MLVNLSPAVRQYLLVTANYWSFTLTDGALRMLVVLHFHTLGYSALDIALLFVFYEAFGVVTNLVGGYLGARLGLNRTMNLGLGLQLLALGMLLVPPSALTVPWVMAAQGLSGIAKDLNKMSAKSSIKTLVPADANQRLYRWVALLTGSKNALKGMGFFLGGLLLGLWGFAGAVMALISLIAVMLCLSLWKLAKNLGKSKTKAKFSQVFSTSPAINALAAARLCLFAARDVWFVVALPVYLSTALGWPHEQVGAFLALWIIGYGAVQSQAPRFTPQADGRTATLWVLPLLVLMGLLTLGMANAQAFTPSQLEWGLVVGLALFALIFAVNSAVHSYLVVQLARSDGVSLDVGFYYMANAMGRLLGTLLSGYLYMRWGLTASLLGGTLLLILTYAISARYLRRPHRVTEGRQVP